MLRLLLNRRSGSKRRGSGGKEEVISRASTDCKRQSVLRADGYGEKMEFLHYQPRQKAAAEMFSNKGLLFLEQASMHTMQQ